MKCLKMLEILAESKLSSKFIVIADNEDLSGLKLFKTFLTNHDSSDSISKIKLICYENPPEYYLTKKTNKKIVCYNFFADPYGWNDPSTPKFDSLVFTSNSEKAPETIFFIDSITHLIEYYGYVATFKNLFALKSFANKIVCLAHSDLLSYLQVEELHFLSTVFINLQNYSNKLNFEEIVSEIILKKPGGKIIRQKEVFLINDSFKIISSVSVNKPNDFNLSKGKRNLENLTTFKLGLHMSDTEKKAKEELILPYSKNKIGSIIYQPDPDEWEDDPDDDLDI